MFVIALMKPSYAQTQEQYDIAQDEPEITAYSESCLGVTSGASTDNNHYGVAKALDKAYDTYFRA